MDNENPDRASAPKPEERGQDTSRGVEAIEPEATHGDPDAAVKTGDRMWGEPGVPPKT